MEEEVLVHLIIEESCLKTAPNTYRRQKEDLKTSEDQKRGVKGVVPKPVGEAVVARNPVERSKRSKKHFLVVAFHIFADLSFLVFPSLQPKQVTVANAATAVGKRWIIYNTGYIFRFCNWLCYKLQKVALFNLPLNSITPSPVAPL